MRIRVVAVGTRLPAWASTGYAEYARRLPRECSLDLHEIPTARRSRAESARRTSGREADRMLRAVPAGAEVVALDERGESWTTEELADRLEAWRRIGRDVALLVGGADGLGAACLERADRRWSLSPLTLPHALVRVIVAEQVYRAWTILGGHPYHRG